MVFSYEKQKDASPERAVTPEEEDHCLEMIKQITDLIEGSDAKSTLNALVYVLGTVLGNWGEDELMEHCLDHLREVYTAVKQVKGRRKNLVLPVAQEPV